MLETLPYDRHEVTSAYTILLRLEDMCVVGKRLKSITYNLTNGGALRASWAVINDNGISYEVLLSDPKFSYA